MKRTLSLSLALLALAGCSRVDYVEIEPSQVLLRRRGEGLQLRAKPMNRNGQYFPREPVSWSADDPKVAKIDRDGQLTAVGPGHAVVTAKAGGRTSTVDVEVRTVETVRVTPASVTLKVDDGAFRPEVEPLDSKGHELKDRTIEMKVRTRTSPTSTANRSGPWVRVTPS